MGTYEAIGVSFRRGDPRCHIGRDRHVPSPLSCSHGRRGLGRCLDSTPQPLIRQCRVERLEVHPRATRSTIGLHLAGPLQPRRHVIPYNCRRRLVTPKATEYPPIRGRRLGHTSDPRHPMVVGGGSAEMISDQPSPTRTATAGQHPRGPRLKMNPAGSVRGYVDGEWWPWSDDLAAESPELVPELAPWAGPISRVSYHGRGRAERAHPGPDRAFRGLPFHGPEHSGGDRSDSQRVSLRAAAEPDSTASVADILASNGAPAERPPRSHRDRATPLGDRNRGGTLGSRRRPYRQHRLNQSDSSSHRGTRTSQQRVAESSALSRTPAPRPPERGRHQ